MSFTEQEIIDQIPHLRRFAIALMKDRDRADDLVQDCLVRAFANATQFKAGTKLRSWLFTILHNLFIDSHRRRGGLPGTANAHDELEFATVEPHQVHNILLNELKSAVSELPKDQRSILLLAAVEGYSYQEVAEIVGVAVGTVKSRLSRAREALREKFYPMESARSTEAPDRFRDPGRRDRSKLAA